MRQVRQVIVVLPLSRSHVMGVSVRKTSFVALHKVPVRVQPHVLFARELKASVLSGQHKLYLTIKHWKGADHFGDSNE